MKLSFTTFRIFLKHSFGISRSSNNWYDIVLIFLQDGNIIGRGEAAPSIRYKESIEKILSVLNQGINIPDSENVNLEKMQNLIYPQLGNYKSLKAAFSMALWDWWTQKKRLPLWKYLGCKNTNLTDTSFTIAIGRIEEIEKKVKEADPYNILKVKLGTPNYDKKIITQIRKFTDKIIRVDANEGWDFNTAIEMCKWLHGKNVEFIEQPFPANELEKSKKLTELSPLDIYADENSRNVDDIKKIKDSFDGINIKLMKCGSIEEALEMIRLAKKYDLKIMLGCMVETSVGITAAASIASNVDKVDLDGNLLIENDPYEGVKVVNGKLNLSSSNGLGLDPKNKNNSLL
tara:strand:+ start:379 stop:1413 length:1035 start_codon:yes stop_codon:yes gene_type:complete